MRFYDIKIDNADTGLSRQYTSYKNGQTDLGALQVELDIPVTSYATPVGGALVRVWGVSLQEIGQASDLNGAQVKVYGGMKKGLPLANPAQSGLLVSGVVNQAFGNWINNDMTLDLVVMAGSSGTGSPDEPKNIVFNWEKGQKLDEAITNALTTAFPDYTVSVNISPDVSLGANEVGYFQSVTQFAQYLKTMSASVVGGDYRGLDINLTDTTFNVYDQTSQSDPRDIAFVDLIGQPTWVGPQEIQVSCVMRADVSVGDYIKLPQTVVTTLPQSLSQYRDKSVFQGTFMVGFVRHVGNFRNPDAQSWVTTLNAFPSTQSSSSQ